MVFCEDIPKRIQSSLRDDLCPASDLSGLGLKVKVPWLPGNNMWPIALFANVMHIPHVYEVGKFLSQNRHEDIKHCNTVGQGVIREICKSRDFREVLLRTYQYALINKDISLYLPARTQPCLDLAEATSFQSSDYSCSYRRPNSLRSARLAEYYPVCARVLSKGRNVLQPLELSLGRSLNG